MVELIINDKIVKLTKENEQRVKRMLFKMYKPDQEIEVKTKHGIEKTKLNVIFSE